MFLSVWLVVLAAWTARVVSIGEILNAETREHASATVTGSAPESDEDCSDRHKQCDEFVDANQCETMPGWMIMNCPVACGACHLRSKEARCVYSNMNMSEVPAYLPGEMSMMFESLIDRFEDRYTINILSTSPYVVTFDDFLSNDEIRALTNEVKEWTRSVDTGQVNELGNTGQKLSEGRTSSNAWCTQDCQANQYVQSLYRKIEEIVGIPRSNYEHFQILRYEIGQKYEVHHDYGAVDQSAVGGPRILTFFLYLSDVDEGGETQFPALGISIRPKKGRAVLWPSVLDRDYMERDGRTMHESRPITRGRKFAANTWIHSHDFNMASIWGCGGGGDLLDPDLVDPALRDGFFK